MICREALSESYSCSVELAPVVHSHKPERVNHWCTEHRYLLSTQQHDEVHEYDYHYDNGFEGGVTVMDKYDYPGYVGLCAPYTVSDFGGGSGSESKGEFEGDCEGEFEASVRYYYW